MLTSQARRLGELLVDRHVVSRSVIESALAHAERSGESLPMVLAQHGVVSAKDLTAAVAEASGARFVDLLTTTVHPDAPKVVSGAVARTHQALAVQFDGGDLLVAFADPTNTVAIEAVQAATPYNVVVAVGDRRELADAIARLYPLAHERTTDRTTDRCESGADEAGDYDGGDYAVPLEVGGVGGGSELHVNDLLAVVLEVRGSDLHLTVGSHPVVRVNGEMRPLTEFPVLNGSTIRQMVYSVLTQKQREKFESTLELDTSYTLPGRSRFRVNVFLQRDSVGAVMRAIPYEIVDFERLKLPPAVAGWADLPRGLVLVTGPTGSGKSTTLASLVDIINRQRAVHIMTVEDPIEFLHQHKRAIVNQREVGEDTHSFASALKHVLRQDPDVILVGEMRDLETISTALTAAETGHLVFATLHTQDAPQSVDRVIDVFPAHQQQQIRVQLAASLQGICTQQLLPTTDGQGRVAACEVLVATPAVRNLIREGKIHQIYSMMQAGGKHGMVTMDMSLAHLVRSGQVPLEVALDKCANEDDVRRMMGGVA